MAASAAEGHETSIRVHPCPSVAFLIRVHPCSSVACLIRVRPCSSVADLIRSAPWLAPQQCIHDAVIRGLGAVLIIKDQWIIGPELRINPRMRVGEAPQGDAVAARLGDAD